VKAVLILIHFEPKQHLSRCTRSSVIIRSSYVALT